MQDQSTSENIKEVIEQDIWGLIQDIWNHVLFSYDLGGDMIYISVGLILLIIFAFVLTLTIRRIISSFVPRKLPDEDNMKFISIFKFIHYYIYFVVLLIYL